MKTLKLNHSLAEKVIAGKKTATWRLYDDKDISVNDAVTLIDKINPQDQRTWQPIGVAHVDTVVQKRLGDVTEEDLLGQEQFASREDMLQTYRTFYGKQVELGTPVKIIHFTFVPQSLAHDEDKNTTKLTEVKMFADGGSRGNPGPSASGYVVMDMDENIIVKQGVYLGLTTNNQAEYQALRLGLEEVKKTGARRVHVYMDSLLVVNQMLGIFKVKNRDLWPIHEAIKKLASDFEHITFTHVPREFNKQADAAVNEALDAEASRTKSHAYPNLKEAQ